MIFKYLALPLIATFFTAFPASDNPGEAAASRPQKSLQSADSRQEDDYDAEQALDALCERSGDLQESGIKGKHVHREAIHKWLDSLQPFQQAKARKILQEAQPGMMDLQRAIRNKKSELAELSFDRNTAPETLPRLGMELQELRAILRHKLRILSNRLYFEAGAKPGLPGFGSLRIVPYLGQSCPLFPRHHGGGKIS